MQIWGHPLVLEKLDRLKLNHGIMELGYVDHQGDNSRKSNEDDHDASSILMTATLNTNGHLVLAEFKGFSREVDKSILKSIWDRGTVQGNSFLLSTMFIFILMRTKKSESGTASTVPMGGAAIRVDVFRYGVYGDMPRKVNRIFM